MIFASTPATGSALHKGPGRYLAAGVGWGRVHEANPILLEFRKYATNAATGGWRQPLSAPALAAHWTMSDLMWDEVCLHIETDEPLGTPEQEVHARRVLTRLALWESPQPTDSEQPTNHTNGSK